jgi:hypothetical protein
MTGYDKSQEPSPMALRLDAVRGGAQRDRLRPDLVHHQVVSCHSVTCFIPLIGGGKEMAYWITFRIADKTVGAKTYSDRRQALIDAAYTKGSGWWDEPASFVFVSNPSGTEAFTKKLGAALSATDDLLVVHNTGDGSSAYFGDVKHPDVLKSFLPGAKKVP